MSAAYNANNGRNAVGSRDGEIRVYARMKMMDLKGRGVKRADLDYITWFQAQYRESGFN